MMLKIIVFFLAFAQPCTAQFAVMMGRDKAGLFSQLDDVITGLRFVEQGVWSGLEVAFESQPYREPGKGDNWWTYYFEPLSIGTQEHPFVSKDCIVLPFTRTEAHRYIQKYIKIKPHIQAKVEEFVNGHFKGHTVICVHFRGTDKMGLEAPVLTYGPTAAKIISLTKKLTKGKCRVFLATDEKPFLNYLRSQISPIKVLSYSDIFSKDKKPIHLDPSNSYKKGEEALIDAILLSRGDFLIRTISNLSRWSTYFNPHIPEYVLTD